MLGTLSALLLLAVAHADDPFKGMVECARTIGVCAPGAQVRVVVLNPSSSLILMKSSRQGKEGFYAYGEEDAYFHEFPPPPAERPKPPPPTLWNLYGVLTRVLHPEPPPADPHVYYELEAGYRDAVYLGFLRRANGEMELTASSISPIPGVAHYLPGGGGECHADEESRSPLRTGLTRALGTVYANYSSSPKPAADDVANEINIVGHTARVFYDPSDCLRSLDACTDDPDLKAVATAERAKFPKQAPGAH